MGEIAQVRTPLNEWEASSYLVYIYEQNYGPMPTNLAELMLAQIWIETGQGSSIWNYNVGNLSGEYQGNYWRPPWYEVDESSSNRYKELHQLMLDNKAPSKFQAYPDFETGFGQYLKLYQKDRYKPLLQAGISGNAFEFAKAIFETGYCPDDPQCRPENTASTIEYFQNKFRDMGLFAYDDTVSKDKTNLLLLLGLPVAMGGILLFAKRKK